MPAGVYTPSVPETLSLFFFALATILFLGALAAGWIAAREPVSPRKGRAKFWAYACVGLAFVAIGVPLLLHQLTQPTVPFAGTIASVHRAGGKASASTLHVQLKNGCPLVLHTNRSSPHFHPGQALEGRYAAGDGTLLSAKFFDKNGRQQGDFNGQMLSALPYGMLLLGAFFVFAGWLLYRRDPLGANNARPSR